MSDDDRLSLERFPRASRYHPEWVLAGASGGANPLWLAEWLCEALDLKPGMRVLDLGCGRAMSSVFLRREYGASVWAVDLWFDPAENAQRIADAGVGDGVFPLRADARGLPFADGFFDAIVSIDSFLYYGTDELYLNYLARFLKPRGVLAISQAGFAKEVPAAVPDHLAGWWAEENPFLLHSANWWANHWQRTGLVEVDQADTMPEGWKLWQKWLELLAPDNKTELAALEDDAGEYFTYIRCIAHRREDAQLFDPSMSFPSDYTKQPLLRDE